MCYLIYITIIILITLVINSSGQKKPQIELAVSQNDLLDDSSSQQEIEAIDIDNEVSKNEFSIQEIEVISKEGPPKGKTSSPWNRKDTSYNKNPPATTRFKISKTIQALLYKDHGEKSSNNISKSSEEKDEQTRSSLLDYPFSVSIQKKGAHYVSGALIDKRWILSVAGEFYNVRESIKLFRARLGSVDCKKGGTLVPIKKVEIHPYYVHGKPNFDVALLRLAMPVDFTDVVSPIGISNIKGNIISAKFMTTYWPRVMIKGKLMPRTAKERIKYNSMRVSTQKLIPIDTCIAIMKALDEVLNESSLCMKPIMAHHSICMPDAGAPVIAEDGLWGITSGWISPTCPNYTAPTIFTRLSSSSVRSWLDTKLLNL